MLWSNKKVFLLFFWCANFASTLPISAADTPERTLGWPGISLDGNSCSGQFPATTAFDYTNSEHRAKRLRNIEIRHFTPEVEQLVAGKSTTNIGADIFFTLRYFPNHHRALYSMMRYQLKKRGRADNSIPKIECFLERATDFTPKDANVHFIYGIFFHRKGLLNRAVEKYHIAEKLKPNSAMIQYNMGLLYVDMKNTKQARLHAKKAYALGHPFPGLKNKLIKLGVWND